MKKTNTCEICGKSYISKISLNLHKKYKCGVGVGSTCPLDEKMSLGDGAHAPSPSYGIDDELCPENNPIIFKSKYHSIFMTHKTHY